MIFGFVLAAPRNQILATPLSGTKGVAGKKFRDGRTRFGVGGGGGTPQNPRFRANHKGPSCELFWDPGFRGGGPSATPLSGTVAKGLNPELSPPDGVGPGECEDLIAAALAQTAEEGAHPKRWPVTGAAAAPA